jgi:DNA polymerase elongation subunit (family B)
MPDCSKSYNAGVNLHGQVISFESLKKTLPARYSYLKPDDVNNINKQLTDNSEILFLPTYTQETHMQDEKYAISKFKIVLNGIFRDGRRANVIIDEIEPYFEVHIPDGIDGTIKVGRGREMEFITQQSYIERVCDLLNRDKDTTPHKTSKILGKPFKYYQEDNSTFLRFYYWKTKARKTAIQLVRQQGYNTTHDDLGSYYRVVCRDYLTTLSVWATLNNYRPAVVEMLKGNNNIDTYRLDINDYKAFDGEMTTTLLKDKTLSMTWDIETWSKEGNVPLPENETDCIFCIGMTFQWVNEDKPFLKIALVDYPSNAKPDHLTVVCGSENFIIKAFGEVFEKMRPEFIIGFNDSDYDWNWLINRACATKGLVSRLAKKLSCTLPWKSYNDADVMKYNYRKEHVKVEADMYADGHTLMMNGYIPIDVRTIFRKIYPTAESSSLKWFLAKMNLSGKDDMPYQTMFKIYAKMRKIFEMDGVNFDEGRSIDFDFDEDISDDVVDEYNLLKEQLADVNKYCVVDALRCHELCKIRSVIMDHREVSNVSYTSVYDAFYRANGMKVRNLTIAVGQNKKLPFNIRFTNITNVTNVQGKYPGAYVFPPKKGLQISKLTIKERIKKANLTKNSKRKSMQDWLNTTDEEIKHFYDIITEYGPSVEQSEKIEEIEKKWGKLPKKFIEFMTDHMGRPITGLDFSSLYPSLIRCYNFSPEYCIKNKKHAMKVHASGQKLNKVDFYFNDRRCKAWFVGHNNKINPEEDDFQFGVYPYILNDLFNKRKAIKKNMKVFAHQKELMEIESAEYLKEHFKEYEDICFNYNYLNSKQLALKVFMNTFYGEAGNKLSPFFVVEVAGGITMAGQKNIKMSQSYVEKQGHEVYYGDTDSIYLAMAHKHFKEIDDQYYTGKIDKLEYWTKMVEITFEIIKPLNIDVNEMFFKDNGTRFLLMAYEEALFPVAFTAKKKYFGIPHENIANFNPKHLFIRGLEVKKRGVSNLLKKIFNELMMTACVDRDNLYTLMELSLTKIDDIYNNRKWKLEDFIKTDVFRPNKNNIKVHTFVRRMAEKGIVIPNNERFKYIMVKKYPYTYDHRGCKSDITTGDRMELINTVKDQNLEIDLDYYMKGSVNGQLARLVVYHEMFHVNSQDNTDIELKVAEDLMFKNATKFIKEYAGQYYSNYNQFGKAYQKVFRTSNKALGDKIMTQDKLAHQLISANVPDTGFEEWFIELIDKKAIKLASTHGHEYVAGELQKLPKENRRTKTKIMQKVYYGEHMRDANGNNVKSILTTRTESFRNTMSILRRLVRENVAEYRKLYSKYRQCVNDISKIIKNSLKIGDKLYGPTKEASKYILEDFGDIDGDMQTELEAEAEIQADNIMSDGDLQKTLSKFKTIYADILSAHLIYRRTQSIVDALKSKRDAQTRTVMRPDDDYMRKVIEEDVRTTLEDVGDLGLM